MERTATVSTQWFFVKRNARREVMEKKTISLFAGILKECLTLSVVIMLGAVLTFLLGS